MNILITGGSGLLGSNLVEFLQPNHTVYYPTRKEFNIENYPQMLGYVNNISLDIIIHCAAISKFIEAENRPIDTINTNIIGTCNITKLCLNHNIRLVYISTSHVFDGEKGNYTIDDTINPLTKYSKSKAAGEMITSIVKESLIIRTEFCGKDFPFETAFVDKFSSKEYIDIITPQIASKSTSTQIGICHVGGPRRSFYEFGKIRNPNVKPGYVKDLKLNINAPILIDTSLISN